MGCRIRRHLRSIRPSYNLNGNLERLALGNLLNGNRAVDSALHEQTLQIRRCTGKDNLRIVILAVPTRGHRTRAVSPLR